MAALSGTAVIPSAKFIVSSFEQPLNAPDAIDVTVDGTIMLLKLIFPLNAPDPIV